MAIEGAMQIEGGNWQIFDNMVKASNSTVLLNTSVNSITKNGRDNYSLKATKITQGGIKQSTESIFDTVVLAAPLQFSNIEVEDGLFKHIPDLIPYVTLHVTLFTSPSLLNPAFFNLAPDSKVPTTILTTLPPDEIPDSPEDGVGSPGFFSISTLRQVVNPRTEQKEYLYKIFSPREITQEFLSNILTAPGSFPFPPLHNSTNQL